MANNILVIGVLELHKPIILEEVVIALFPIRYEHLVTLDFVQESSFHRQIPMHRHRKLMNTTFKRERLYRAESL